MGNNAAYFFCQKWRELHLDFLVHIGMIRLQKKTAFKVYIEKEQLVFCLQFSPWTIVAKLRLQIDIFKHHRN